MPLFSIVIANYNYGRFLEEAILSVLSQKVERESKSGVEVEERKVSSCVDTSVVELIVIDGGSTDNSVDIIKKYAGGLPPGKSKYEIDERKSAASNHQLQHSTSAISYWISEPDRGQSHAFNKGFAHAHGRFLTWLNADDILLPGALEAVAKEIDRHPQCQWFVGSSVWCDEHLFIMRVFRAHSFSKMRLCSRDLTCGGPSSFFSRELFESTTGFDVNLHLVMDNDLWYRFVFQKGVKYRRTRALVWVYRFHSESKMAGRVVDPNSTLNQRRQRQIDAEAKVLSLRYGVPNAFWRMTRRLPVSLLDSAVAFFLNLRFRGHPINKLVPASTCRHRVLLSNAIQEYIKGLRRMPVEVFAFNNWSRKKFSNREGVTFFDNAIFSNVRACTALVEQNNIDILYAQGFRSLLYFYFVKRRCVTHKPMLITNCHSPSLWDNWRKSILLILFACLVADGFVFLSENTQKKWHWLTVLFRLKTFHVRNPVELGRFTGVKTSCSPRLTIGCIGSIVPRKHQLMLVEIVNRLRGNGIDARARIAGDVSSPEYKKMIEERIIELSLSEYVSLDPIVPYDDVPAWMARNDIYLCPSDAEVMPFSILEAMATGLPVVAHDVAAIGEEVRDGLNGHLVRTMSVNDYVAAIMDILKNDKWRDMGSKGRMLAESEFSLDEYACQMNKVFAG